MCGASQSVAIVAVTVGTVTVGTVAMMMTRRRMQRLVLVTGRF